MNKNTGQDGEEDWETGRMSNGLYADAASVQAGWDDKK